MYNEVTYLAHSVWYLESDLPDFVREFRGTIYKEPEELPHIFDAYGELVESIIENIDQEKRDKVTLACIAGFCVLADHDYDGSLTSRSLENGFDFLVPFYDNPKEYGLAMAALSVHLGLEGELLGEYAFGNYTIH